MQDTGYYIRNFWIIKERKFFGENAIIAFESGDTSWLGMRSFPEMEKWKERYWENNSWNFLFAFANFLNISTNAQKLIRGKKSGFNKASLSRLNYNARLKEIRKLEIHWNNERKNTNWQCVVRELAQIKCAMHLYLANFFITSPKNQAFVFWMK